MQKLNNILNFFLFLSYSFILNIGLSSFLYAEEYENLKKINTTAIEYVRSNMPAAYEINSLQSGRIDSRLKLKKCTEPLSASTSAAFKVRRQFTVAVACVQPNWKIYVSIKADITQRLVVAKATIFRGETITADMLKIEKRGIRGSQRHSFRNIADVIGKQAKRNINIDSLIKASQLKAPLLVKRRQKVIILAKNDILQVKMQGIALKNGKRNELIKVRNLNSNIVVEGVVIAQGVVRVNF